MTTQQEASKKGASNQVTQAKLNIKQIQNEIEKIVLSTARECIVHWRIIIPLYFNRRAFGLFEHKQIHFHQLADNMAIPYELYRRNKGMPYGEDRRNTGQLENALSIKSLSHTGATLYVEPCHAKTDGRDYVEILVHGAAADGDPYHPGWDRRSPANRRKGSNEKWGGIPTTYWAIMQYEFIKYLESQEYEMNKQIERLLTAHNIINQPVTTPVSKQPKNAQKPQYINTKNTFFSAVSPIDERSGISAPRDYNAERRSKKRK